MKSTLYRIGILAIVLLALGAWLPGPGGGIFVQAPVLAQAKYDTVISHPAR